ncbi:MAG TPA: tripartite tricarboxylate transporter substrate-binding protein [Xanthobacteraceae bacterium]|jgi:tripartite-type tricarboxylate transporter receptor subunit TctC|nr:tripartite tricarboxylate transporter substrate-binding protein [Xanthobacteraceae bacterium]
MKLGRVFAATLLLATLTVPARAADQFPSRTITLVVPLTPGTAIDIVARLYADKLSQLLGQQIVVLNKPGAGGVIGGETVANATPDGYTLLFANSGHSILGFVNKSMPFDPIHDFAGVSMVGVAPAIVVVPSALGVKTLKEFIDLAKAKPGSINYGSAGIGTSTHLAGAYFAAQTKIDLVHVPYTVSTNIISDMLSGAIQASFDPLAFVLSFLQNGSLRGLAVGADEPITDPVNIPTAVAQGVDYHYATWYGILAPAKTPKPNLKTLADVIVKVSQDPDLAQKIKTQGIRPDNITLDAFDAYVDKDVARLEPLIKGIDVKQ